MVRERIQQNMRKIIVIDGHDASGKTSICKRISEILGYKYIKPFSNSLGDLIAWLITCKNYKLANQIAMSAIDKVLKENPKSNLIFDRHWICMFTLIPDDLKSDWHHIPFSIICWANPEITLTRLHERNDIDINKWDNEYFCKKYLEVGERYHIPIIDTSFISVDEGVEKAMKIILENWSE